MMTLDALTLFYMIAAVVAAGFALIAVAIYLSARKHQ